jgi:hypothetical protein
MTSKYQIAAKKSIPRKYFDLMVDKLTEREPIIVYRSDGEIAAWIV